MSLSETGPAHLGGRLECVDIGRSLAAFEARQLASRTCLKRLLRRASVRGQRSGRRGSGPRGEDSCDGRQLTIQITAGIARLRYCPDRHGTGLASALSCPSGGPFSPEAPLWVAIMCTVHRPE